ncbi:unnamed protein product [Heterobilharzia americana]|nr:unnamed protein product [Heterobilharzia americana]
MTSFGKYVSNFVKTAVSSISPNKIISYTISQYESEYQDCEQLLQEKSIYYFYKVANHFDMIYLPGSVGSSGNGENIHAYSLFRFQGEEEAGVAVFSRYIEVLDPLHSACVNIGLTIDRTCLEKVTGYSRNQYGWGAAHVAAAMSWRELFLGESVRKLLNEYDPISGLTPLRVSIKEKDRETVRFLVTLDNIMASESDEDGNTVLHLASEHTSKEILSLLLENLRGLNVNRLNKYGESPLHIACRSNSIECVEELLKVGCNPLVGESESFPIHIAVSNDSLECVNLLYTYCPSCISLPDLSNHSTPIHLAHNFKIFERLCNLGANLDARNDMGLTVLHIKVRDNNFEDTLTLLMHGADPNLRDIDGATPLHYAIIYNSSIHIIRALLAFEADPCALNNNQHSCRHLLCRHSESYIHSDERDLALYTLDAVGVTRCPPDTVNCTAGCMDLESAKKCNLNVFNGTRPEVVHHLVDVARESIEEILLSATSLNLSRLHSLSQISKLQTVNSHSNSSSKLNSKYLRSVTSQLTNSEDNHDNSNENKSRIKIPKLQRQISLCSNLYQQVESSTSATLQSPVFSIPSDSESELTPNTHLTEQLDYNKFAGISDNLKQLPVNTNSNGIGLPDTTFCFKPTKCACDRSVVSKCAETPMDFDVPPLIGSSNLTTTATKATSDATVIQLTEDKEVIDLSSEEEDFKVKTNGDGMSHLHADDSCHHLSDSCINNKQCSKWSCGPRGYRVLSLDGGGIRGLIIIELLRALEIASGKKVTELFDWIIGTSTGGAISLFVMCGKCLHCCRTLLFRFKDLVFCGKRPYPSETLETLMRNEFGENTVMTDLKHIRVAVTTLVGDRCPPLLHMFRNYKSPRARIQHIMETRQCRSKSFACPSSVNKNKNGLNHRRSTSVVQESSDRETQSPKSPSLSTSHSILNFFMNAQGLLTGNETNTSLSSSDVETGDQFERIPPDNEQLVWKAARASSAAPTYFRPCGRFLDGGLISNNPTLDILTEIQELHLLQRLKNKPVTPIAVVVSLGTGRMPVVPVETVDVFRPQNIMETYRSVLGFSFLGRILVEVAPCQKAQLLIVQVHGVVHLVYHSFVLALRYQQMSVLIPLMLSNFYKWLLKLRHICIEFVIELNF